jgi:hypothetical protein
VTHHWRPSDGLIAGPRPGGEWTLYDRSRLVGTVQTGKVGSKRAFRGLTPEGDLVGYAWTLESACDRLWAWHVLVRTGGTDDGVAVAPHPGQ